MLASCASSPERIVVHPEVIELYRNVMVPVPAEMTARVPVPVLPSNLNPEGLGVTYLRTVNALESCNSLLEDISVLPYIHAAVPDMEKDTN